MTKAQYLKTRYNLVFEITPGITAGTEGALEHKRSPMSCFFQTLRCNLLCYLRGSCTLHICCIIIGNNKEALFVLRQKSRIFNPALERINITITVTMHQALPNKFNQPMTDYSLQEYLL